MSVEILTPPPTTQDNVHKANCMKRKEPLRWDLNGMPIRYTFIYTNEYSHPQEEGRGTVTGYNHALIQEGIRYLFVDNAEHSPDLGVTWYPYDEVDSAAIANAHFEYNYPTGIYNIADRTQIFQNFDVPVTEHPALLKNDITSSTPKELLLGESDILALHDPSAFKIYHNGSNGHTNDHNGHGLNGYSHKTEGTIYTNGNGHH